MGGSVATTVLGGRYELQELVGLGGAAEVYRAHDARLDLTVAVKLFLTGGSEPGQYRQRQEVELLTALAHPGLVGLRDAGSERGHGWLVMDFVAGFTLAERLTDGPVSAADVVELGAGLAAALDFVHQHGVVHRDIKPANILLDVDHAPRLTDFGISRLVDATRVTATGSLVGTPAYLSPEQVLGERVGTAADVYALGLVLLECLTGQREYPGGAVEAAIARLHRAPVVPEWVPLPLRRLLSEMTARDPAKRPSAGHVAAVLATPSITTADLTRPCTQPLPSGRESRGQAMGAGQPPTPHRPVGSPHRPAGRPHRPVGRSHRPEGRRSRLQLPGGLVAAAASGLVALFPGWFTDHSDHSGAAKPWHRQRLSVRRQRLRQSRRAGPSAVQHLEPRGQTRLMRTEGMGPGKHIRLRSRVERDTVLRGRDSEPVMTRESERGRKSESSREQS